MNDSSNKKAPPPSDVAATIQEIIAKHMKMQAAEIRPQAHLRNDLGAESLDSLEIILAIEEAFNIDIPDEEARKAATVQDVIDYVQRHLRK